MAISRVKVPDQAHKLMMAIGEAVAANTRGTQMRHEDIVGVLAFCTGAAIARDSKGRNHRRQMREMADENVTLGIQFIMNEAAPSIILPDNVH